MAVSICGKGGVGKGETIKIIARKQHWIMSSNGKIFYTLGEKRGYAKGEWEDWAKQHPDVDEEVDEEVRKFGRQHRYYVIDGRLAWWTLPKSFKVRLTCEWHKRIWRIKRRDGFPSFEAARDFTQARERSAKERYKKFYKITDYNHRSHFDLSVDTTHLTPVQVAAKVLRGYKAWQKKKKRGRV